MSSTKTIMVSVLFGAGPVRGTVLVKYGSLGGLRTAYDWAKTATGAFDFASKGEHRLDVVVENANVMLGKQPTVVTVLAEEHPFSFFLRDVQPACPIYIPEYAVVVTTCDDRRTFRQLVSAIETAGARSDFNRFEAAPEESFKHAASLNRNERCATWLGVDRDLRHFRVQPDEPARPLGFWGMIKPMFHSKPVNFLGMPDLSHGFAIGQGASCRPQITRRLEDGVLPILHSDQVEDDVIYHLTFFATLESGPLTGHAIRGSDWLAAYCTTGGNMLTHYRPKEMSEGEWDDLQRLIKAETLEREEELVLVTRIVAENTGAVPRYAWFKAPWMNGRLPEGRRCVYDGERGFCMVDGDFVHSVNRIASNPMRDEEMAVLIMPGQTITAEFLIPHVPVSPERAARLASMNVDEHLAACKAYWGGKLASAAAFRVPEMAIDERIRAGLLHCDLVTLGKTADGPLLATIGWYSPIGSESSPIIQYYDSVGWHKQAERCIDFFFARQRADGFIQNFANYQLETGPVLWCVGEHFRYTRDAEWLGQVGPNVRKAVDYLMKWIERNRKEEYREQGFYGMIEGKVADCNDFYHSFMLNAVTYLGLRRIAEVYAGIDDELAGMLAAELPGYRQDIRTGFYHALARAPVVPVGDGSWAPMPPPWVEYTGAISLYADGGKWFTHGAFASRSCLTGALYLIVGEVLDPDEMGADMLLKTNQQPVTRENAALSQPYYCRHDIAHLRRGEVKPFLKLYYNQMTALQDRETYTFWEHYYHASEHKTHEEGWFLMQTRWMLYMEEGRSLSLLKAIPRRWLRNGQSIDLKGAASYFGHFDLHVASRLSEKTMEASIRFDDPARLPDTLRIRLPHPEEARAVRCHGGTYDPATETVVVGTVEQEVRVKVEF